MLDLFNSLGGDFLWEYLESVPSFPNQYFSSSFYRAIPCQRSEKKGQHQKVDFFDEMWKITRQIDDLGRFLNNFCNFGVFLAKNQKYPKITVLKKWKLKMFFFLIFFLIKQLISIIIYNILIVWILWFYKFALSFAMF